mmetsp:Transcript_15434/g.26508  ORF Transcript_15434/g.26508 Transcript_15434/m.26508 type:complete len:643 (-) Transcript_15434:35-1963(-)
MDDVATGGHPNCLVLGAGIAGLAAAQELRRLQFDVVVLEARSRPGGRVLTSTSFGHIVDLGPSWIHGIDGNPITDICEKLNLRLQFPAKNPEEQSAVYDYDGSKIPTGLIEATKEKMDVLLEEHNRLVSTSDDDSLTLGDSLHALMESHNELDGLERRLLQYHLSGIEGYCGASADWLSGKNWSYDSDLGFPGEHCIVADGYQGLVDDLQAGLDIRYEHTVTRVEWSPEVVCVHTRDHGRFFARVAVVTFPLAVLQSGAVTFDPPLPHWKIRSINNLGMGLLDKLVLCFEHVFWDGKVDWIGYARDAGAPETFSAFLNMHKVNGAPMLVGFVSGRFAESLERCSDAEVVEEAMKVLARMYGDAIQRPTSFHMTRWRADALSGGSYSFVPPGAGGRDYECNAFPVGNVLYFAGEGTIDKYPGTVHGAYISGIREARRIHRKSRTDFRDPDQPSSQPSTPNLPSTPTHHDPQNQHHRVAHTPPPPLSSAAQLVLPELVLPAAAATIANLVLASPCRTSPPPSSLCEPACVMVASGDCAGDVTGSTEGTLLVSGTADEQAAMSVAAMALADPTTTAAVDSTSMCAAEQDHCSPAAHDCDAPCSDDGCRSDAVQPEQRHSPGPDAHVADCSGDGTVLTDATPDAEL